MREDDLTVLLFRVGASPERVTIPNELEEMQRLVGGYIEQIRLFDNVVLICNEEGKNDNLPPNRLVPGVDMIVGDFYVTACDGEDYTNLTPEQEWYVVTLRWAA